MQTHSHTSPLRLTHHQWDSINGAWVKMKWPALFKRHSVKQITLPKRGNAVYQFGFKTSTLRKRKKKKKSAWWQQMQKESISWNMPGSFHLNRLWTAASVKAATASQLYTFTLTDSSFSASVLQEKLPNKTVSENFTPSWEFLSSHKCEWLLLLLLWWNAHICSEWDAV